MTAKRKLEKLERSINRACAGLTKIIHCPYCHTDLDFSPPSALDEAWQPPTCCATFAYAAIAILQRKEQTETADLASRIRDNAGGLPVFN